MSVGTTTTSKVSAVLVALRDALLARGGLAGVTVFALPQRVDDLGREYIVLATEIPGEQSYPFLGTSNKDEELFLNGVLGVTLPGNGDAVALDALDRALALYGEMEDELRTDPQVGGTARLAELTEFRHSQGALDAGRYHEMSFTIRVQTRLTSS